MSEAKTVTKQETKTFEENLAQLEGIVRQLENGDVPLEEALTAFQKGITLSKTLEATLTQAEETLTKIMTADGPKVMNDTAETK